MWIPSIGRKDIFCITSIVYWFALQSSFSLMNLLIVTWRSCVVLFLFLSHSFSVASHISSASLNFFSTFSLWSKFSSWAMVSDQSYSSKVLHFISHLAFLFCLAQFFLLNSSLPAVSSNSSRDLASVWSQKLMVFLSHSFWALSWFLYLELHICWSRSIFFNVVILYVSWLTFFPWCLHSVLLVII